MYRENSKGATLHPRLSWKVEHEKNSTITRSSFISLTCKFLVKNSSRYRVCGQFLMHQIRL